MNLRERIAHAGLLLATLVVLAPLVLIIGTIVVRGADFMTWEFLSQAPSGDNTRGGVFPAIVGTIPLVVLTLSIALPLGVLAAVFLREYAGDSRLARAVRLAILNLAGVPSVVHGLFGLAVFVRMAGFGSSLLAGACTLALLILPIIIATSEEALRAVPDAIRHAALALGATRWQTVRRAVLPAALPGMLTGSILGLARAAGETAPTMFTVAVFWKASLPQSVYDDVMLLPYHLYVLATKVPGIPDDPKYATALVLLTIVLGLNLTAIILRATLQRRRGEV